MDQCYYIILLNICNGRSFVIIIYRCYERIIIKKATEMFANYWYHLFFIKTACLKNIQKLSFNSIQRSSAHREDYRALL